MIVNKYHMCRMTFFEPALRLFSLSHPSPALYLPVAGLCVETHADQTLFTTRYLSWLQHV
jgi:hypothetical protein